MEFMRMDSAAGNATSSCHQTCEEIKTGFFIKSKVWKFWPRLNQRDILTTKSATLHRIDRKIQRMPRRNRTWIRGHKIRVTKAEMNVSWNLEVAPYGFF